MKRLIKKLFKLFGVEISLIKRNPDGLNLNGKYTLINPYAKFSPWNIDDGFLKTYNIVKAYTLIDMYRCYELWELVEQSSKLKRGSLIEIGVWKGGSGGLISKRAQQLGIKENVILCDTFGGVVKAGKKDTFYNNGEHSNTDRLGVEELLKRGLNLNNTLILEGIFPEQTGDQISLLRFRFCHIDVDVYDSAKDIVNWIWGKMEKGGIIVFDDYGFETCDGITEYVNELRKKNDLLFFYNLNGHGIIIKI